MAKKNAEKWPFREWETAKAGGVENRYIRCGNSQMLHPAMMALTPLAFQVYQYARLEAGAGRDFEYPRSKYSKIVNVRSFNNALDELVRFGFIEIIQRNFNLRKADVYRLSSKWRALSKEDIPSIKDQVAAAKKQRRAKEHGTSADAKTARDDGLDASPPWTRRNA